MESEQWKILVTVLECGTFTAAADRLGYTLSGISRSMAALEKEIGIQLLYRGKKGVIPTADCEKLLPYAREFLFASNKLNQAASVIRGGEEGEIGIGTAYRHYYRWLTEVTSAFHTLHPGVHFRICDGTSTELSRQIEEHSIDFAIISKREGSHQWYPICKDPLIAFLSVDHRLAQREKITLDELTKEPYVATCPGKNIENSQIFDSMRFFASHKIKPNIQFTTTDVQATYAMVDAGLGVSITNQLNSIHSYPDICHRQIEPTEYIEIGLACTQELPPAAEAFLKFLSVSKE